MRKLIASIAILLFLLSGTGRAQEPILFGTPNQGVVTAQQTYSGTTGTVAMSFTLFATVFTAINDPLENSVNGVVNSLVDYVRASMQPVILLAIMLGALAVMFGDKADAHVAIMVTARTCARASFIMSLLAGGAAFSQFVITPFLNFPKEVSALLLGATGQQALNGGAPFDTALVHMFKADFNAMMKVGFFSAEGFVAGIVIGLSAIFSALFIGFMFASWMVGYVLFYLVMAISPLFVATMMLTFTKRFFAGWLAAAVGSSLLLILISVLLSIVLKVQQQLVDLVMNAPANADKWGMVGSAIGMCVLTALGALAAYKADSKAHGMAGGIYLNTMSYVGTMGNVSWNTMNSALSWAGGMANGGSRSLPAPSPSVSGVQGGAAPAAASLSGSSPWGRRP